MVVVAAVKHDDTPVRRPALEGCSREIRRPTVKSAPNAD